MQQGEEYEGFLKEKGTSLLAVGVNEIALSREDALYAIGILREIKRPILGGDVYFRQQGQIKPAYANWYVNSDPTENRETHAHRSYEVTKAYIQEFPKPPTGIEELFTLVVSK